LSLLSHKFACFFLSFSNKIIPYVRKYRPQNDYVERSDLAKRSFIAGWERERAETAEGESRESQEREPGRARA
jgi:hypothetical protein